MSEEFGFALVNVELLELVIIFFVGKSKYLLSVVEPIFFKLLLES